MSSSTSNSPCAACKFLRRKCTQGCVFAPYFPPDNPGKFAHVHRVFGASNVAKILNELSPEQREDAVNSLAYEAEARLRDPVYGCVGFISVLQQRLLLLQRELSAAKKELASLIGPAPFGPFGAPNHFQGVPAGMGMGLGLNGPQIAPAAMLPVMYRDQHQHEQQIVVAREHEMLRGLEQQQELERLMGGAPAASGASIPQAVVSPAVGGFVSDQQQQQQQQQQENFHEGIGHYLHHNLHHSRGNHDGRSGIGPSS